MADGSSFLGDFGDILKGGLGGAIDVELEKRRAEFENPTLYRGDTDRGISTDDGRVIRVGTFPRSLSEVSPVMIAAAGLALVVLVVVLLRR